MTLKTLINRVERKLTLDASTTVIGNTDLNVADLLECANEEGKELSKRNEWQSLQKETTFVATATETQANVLPADMGNPKRFVRGTLFNRTRKRPLRGPLTPEEWQRQKSLDVSALTAGFRIRGNEWLSIPIATVSDVYAFEYISSYWVDTDQDGLGEAEEWVADTDTSLLPEDLMYLGILWRFLASRKFVYAEEFTTYEKQVVEAKMRDGPKRAIDFSYDYHQDLMPGVLVNEGSWAL